MSDTQKTTDRISAYEFVQLGEKLADALIQAAEDQVTKAQLILDQTRSMADILRTQVTAQAKQIEDMQARFRAFGEQMLGAHRKLSGEEGDPPALAAPALRRRQQLHEVSAEEWRQRSD